MAGTVASAIRFLAKEILTGGTSQEFLRSQRGRESLQGGLTSDRGLGEPIIAEFLHGIHGISAHVIRQQLANLKASGDYARLIAEVEAEIACENQEALAAFAAEEARQVKRRERSRYA
jgi:hypothetical protein